MKGEMSSKAPPPWSPSLVGEPVEGSKGRSVPYGNHSTRLLRGVQRQPVRPRRGIVKKMEPFGTREILHDALERIP